MQEKKTDQAEIIKSSRTSVGQIIVLRNDEQITFGSGFVYGDKRTFVTSKDLLDFEDIEEITIRLADTEERYSAKVSSIKMENELAILKLNKDSESFLTHREDNATLSEGTEVLVMGFPFEDWTLLAANKGMISAAYTADDDELWYLIDATVNTGNEGSPVLDMNGKVVAVMHSRAIANARAILDIGSIEGESLRINDFDVSNILGNVVNNLQTGLGKAIPFAGVSGR